MVLLCLLFAHVVFAQGTTIGEADYWGRMERTETLLSRALEGVDSAQDEMRTLWSDVRAVQVGDDAVAVNMNWLEQPSSDSAVLQQRLREVRALRAYHEQLTGGASPPSQETLNEVLQDPRFQYPTPTPLSPLNEMPDFPNLNPTISPEFAQLLLVVGAAALVGVVLVYVARSLRIQRAKVGPALEEDDPTTSDDAHQRADESEASQDYRSAIRYLYLACLLLLDEKGLIRYDRTLTNREHLRMVANEPQLAALLRPVISTFDDVWYGFMPIDEDAFQQFRQNVDQLRQLTA